MLYHIPEETAIYVIVGLAFLFVLVELVSWTIIFSIKIVVWAVKKLVYKMKLRKYGIREIPSLDSADNTESCSLSPKQIIDMKKETDVMVSDIISGKREVDAVFYFSEQND